MSKRLYMGLSTVILLVAACSEPMPTPTKVSVQEIAVTLQLTVHPQLPTETATILPTATIRPIDTPTKAAPTSPHPTATPEPHRTEPTATLTRSIPLGSLELVGTFGNGALRDVYFSADSQSLYLSSTSGLYNLSLNQPNATPQQISVSSFAIASPDGTLLFDNGRVIDIETGNVRFETPPLPQEVWAIGYQNSNFSPDSTQLIVKDTVYDTATGMPLHQFDQYTGFPQFSTDGTQLSAWTWGSPDFRIFDTQDWSNQSALIPSRRYFDNSDFDTVDAHGAAIADEQYFVAWFFYQSGSNTFISIHDRASGREEGLIFLPEFSIPQPWREDSCDQPPFYADPFGRNEARALSITPDGNILAVQFAGYNGKRVAVFDVPTRTLLRIFDDALIGCIAPNGQALAIMHESGRVTTWSLPDLTIQTDLYHFTSILAREPLIDSVVLSRDGRYGLTHYRSAQSIWWRERPRTDVRLWDVTSKEELATFPRVQAVFSAENDTLILGYTDGYIERRSLSDNRILNGFTSGDGEILALSVLPNNRIITANQWCEVVEWDAVTGQRIRNLPYSAVSLSEHSEPTRFKMTRLFALGDNLLLGQTYHAHYILWELDTGKIVVEGNSAVISEWFVANNRFWQTAPPDEIMHTIANSPLHDKQFSSAMLAVSPNSDVLVAVGSTIQVWDIATGTLIAETDEFELGEITAVTISADNGSFAVGDQNGFLHVFRLIQPTE